MDDLDQARVVGGRPPGQVGGQMRPVVFEVAVEQRGHEQDHQCARPGVERPLGLQAQIHLVGRKPAHRQVGRLQAQARAHLGGDGFVVGDPVAGDDRFADEQNAGRGVVHALAGGADPVAGGIKGIFDHPPAKGAATDPVLGIGPAHDRIAAAQRFALFRHLMGGEPGQVAQQQFARAQRQDHRDQGRKGVVGEATEPPARNPMVKPVPKRPGKRQRQQQEQDAHDAQVAQLFVSGLEEFRQEVGMQPG